jgi:hypothetical protein
VSGRRWAADLLQPCGTLAAARRHYRHGEKPCPACLAANARAKAGGSGQALTATPDYGGRRNGLPLVPYRYQARRYPWAQRVLATAEARFGTPAGGAS